MTKKNVPIKEVFGNTASMLGLPVTKKYHPSLVITFKRKFPFIKPVRWRDDSGQAGGIITFVIGIFLIGFFYVALSFIFGEVQTVNNGFITDPNMQYSQDHWNTMNALFQWWWAVPIIAVIVFVIYAFRNAISRALGEA